MNTKHTPGPWYEASTGNHQGLIISESTSANVAVSYDKDDAQIIAAAPDMLQALKRMNSLYLMMMKQCNLADSALSGECIMEMNEAPGQAVKAIAKAEKLRC